MNVGEALERIWAEPGMPGYTDEPNELYTVEYVRADIIKELEDKLQNQTSLIEQFFALLDITEQTDEGRYFRPNVIKSSRAMDAEKMNQVLKELKNVLKDRE